MQLQTQKQRDAFAALIATFDEKDAIKDVLVTLEDWASMRDNTAPEDHNPLWVEGLVQLAYDKTEAVVGEMMEYVEREND